MKTQFICLANSYKEGGRCIAGIELQDGKPVFEYGKPKWIRPVSAETPHGEVPSHLSTDLKLLDVVEIEVTNSTPQGFQKENVLFVQSNIKIKTTFESRNLDSLCSQLQTSLFGNKGKAVSETEIGLLDESLTLIMVDSFRLTANPGTPEKPRIQFVYNNYNYPDLPITDPAFIQKYRANKNLLDSVSKLYLCLSLAIVQNGWHSKLVAGVIWEE